MMQQVYKSFPNNIPITSICVVEDPLKCPPEFNIVLKTHDQDSDADLWREVSFFGRRISRYLCFSKSEAIMDYIVQSISVIHEKQTPPEGFSHIPKTVDGDSKAWRKKQLCCSFVRRKVASSAVTDIILLAKTKHPPDGFCLAGEINGITVCFKTIDFQESSSLLITPSRLQLQPMNGESKSALPMQMNGYPNLESPNGNDVYVNLRLPKRPAPLPPSKTPIATGSYATLSGHLELEGIPFVLNPSLVLSTGTAPQIPVVKAKTAAEIDREYRYDFRLERQLST